MILLNPECRDDEHAKCPNIGLEDETGATRHCPCHCHPTNAKCGNAHELPALAYLGACVMGAGHEGPHQFNGPLDGTVISVTVGDGQAIVTPDQVEADPGVAMVLEDLARAMGHRDPLARDNRTADPARPTPICLDCTKGDHWACKPADGAVCSCPCIMEAP